MPKKNQTKQVTNIFDKNGLGDVKRLEVKQPILTNEDMQKIRKISEIGDNHFVSRVLDTTFDKKKGFSGFEECLKRLCRKAENVVKEGGNIIVLSDRQFGKNRIALPALLAVAVVPVHSKLVAASAASAASVAVAFANQAPLPWCPTPPQQAPSRHPPSLGHA